MLYYPKTRIFKSREWLIDPSSNSLFDGMALSPMMTGGLGGVRDSLGVSATEGFAGIAMQYYTLPATQIVVDTITAPVGGGSVALSFTPNSLVTGGSSAVDLVPTNSPAALTLNAAVGAGQYNLTTTNGVTSISFNTAQGGNTYYVTYRRNLTVDQAALINGESQIYSGVTPTAKIGKISVILSGDVYTDFFDPSVNWFASGISNVSTAPNGMITRGTAGAPINAQVIEAPSVGYPFLGLQITG